MDHTMLPCIKRKEKTGVLVSSKIVCPFLITAKSPFTGGLLPPHVHFDDHTSMYQKSAPVCKKSFNHYAFILIVKKKLRLIIEVRARALCYA